MGNLMGSWRYKEPSTVEECDSTWETDSESDEHQPGGEEEDSGISESMSPAEAARGGEQLEHGSPQVPGDNKGETITVNAIVRFICVNCKCIVGCILEYSV